MLGSQGKFEPAEAAARQALKLRPDSARAHLVLGFALMFQGQLAEAEKELREALRLDPDDAETLMRLGECAKEQGKLDDAIAFWNEAKRLDPTDAAVHAHLGDAYAKKRDRENALRELKEAERLDPEGVNPEQIIWQGYAALHETPLALEHLERFVALARKEGLSPQMVDYMEECGRELKARLTPHEISVAPPRSYTAQSLDAALRARLTPDGVQAGHQSARQHPGDGPLGAGTDCAAPPTIWARPGRFSTRSRATWTRASRAPAPPRKCLRPGTIRPSPFAARNTPSSTWRWRARWA